jgi:hypothetical protein
MAAAAPVGLRSAGMKVWSAIASKYALRPDELVTLEDVCLISDMIAELDAAWAEDGRPMTTKGSMGQKVIHPLIGEIRVQRAARNALWRQLKLPDDEAGAPANQQRAAAQSKWAAGKGRGA